MELQEADGQVHLQYIPSYLYNTFYAFYSEYVVHFTVQGRYVFLNCKFKNCIVICCQGFSWAGGVAVVIALLIVDLYFPAGENYPIRDQKDESKHINYTHALNWNPNHCVRVPERDLII